MVRALALLGTAALLAGVDLTHKSAVGPQNVHPRSAVYAIVVLALAGGWVLAILAARSTTLALSGGVLLGGALGNVGSLVLWAGVPNPLVGGPVAFNLADVFVVAGFTLVGWVTLVFVARNRDRLREPVSLRP